MADSTAKGVAVTPELRSYLLDHSVPQHEAHADLVAATRNALGDLAIMQIAEEQGPFLTWMTRLLGARRAVEVGTFTGLSALCIAEGLAEDGRLTCFDVNEQFVAVGRPFWERAGVADRIDVVIGPAALKAPQFVKAVEYAILKQTTAPACLGLPGYINNPIDKPKLLSELVQNAIGLGYLKALHRDQGQTAYQPK